MGKYDKTTIDAYISGDDIEDYSIDELENDSKFMMLVITLTNDKKIYNLCGEDVKKDYRFVSFVIQKYKDDIDFICKVADFYLNNVDDELTRNELLIKMADLTKGKSEQKNYTYEVLKSTMFTAKRVQIEMGKASLNDDYTSDEIGMGFLLIFDSFNSSKIVINYYAKKMIDAIFDEYDIDLEKMLHEQFKSPEQIDEIGINQYMLNFIRTYDSMLSSYLSTNIDLMEDLSKKIRIVQEKWHKYESIDERRKFNLIFEKVHEYLEQAEHEGMLSETYLLYYACQKLGIVDKLAKYDGEDLEDEDSIVHSLSDEFLEDTLNVSFIDRVHFQNVKRIITSIIFSIGESSSNEDGKGKILTIDFHNKS